MYISDLEIKGFKSFAEPTKMKFAEGLTCIVGPNGCGKTNVVDAIRWVIGEQKSSVLRSQSMQDVIFSGTTTRKQLNYAEVSLTIHNDKGLLPVEYTDVEITRRVFRDGVSEFYINKNACRLKDIHELFVDTGMGSDAYSVIELKMVESILSDNKEERRRLIEEASGINKYKQQRRLSMRRLDSTENDLDRVSDIIAEVEKNVGSLRRQLAKYKRFDRVQNQLKDDEIALAVFQTLQVMEQLVPIQKEIAQIGDGYGASGEEVNIEEKRVEEAKEQLAVIETEFQQQQKKVNDQNDIRVGIEQRLLRAEEKINAANAALDRIKLELKTLIERKESSHELKANLQNQIAHLQPRIEEAKEKDDVLKQAFEKAVEQYREAKSDLDAKNQILLDLINQLSDVNQQKSHQEAALNQYEKSLEHLTTKKTRLIDSKNEYQQELDLVGNDYSDAEKHYAELDKKVGELEVEFQKTQEQLNETREALANKRGRRVSVENQLGFFEELLESGEGYSRGVRALLETDPKKLGILGTVADLITVDEQYEAAIQTALGSLAEALVTKDRKSAYKAISALREEQSGTATFLPLDPLGKSKQNSAALLKGDHVIGPVLDHVTPGSGYEGLANLLLGDVVLVTDEFTPDWGTMTGRAVSLNGTMYDPTGAIIGGAGGEGADTLIGRKDRVQRLRKQYTTLIDEIEALSASIEKFHAQAGNLEREIRTAKTSRDDQRQILLEVERKNSRAQYGINSTEADAKGVDQEITDIQQAIEDAKAKISKTAPQMEKIQAERKTQEAELHAMESALQVLLNERDQASESAQASRLEHVNLTSELRNLETRLNSINETITDIRSRQETLESEKVLQAETLSSNQIILDEQNKALVSVKTVLEREAEILADISDKVQIKRSALNEFEIRLRDHHHQREAAAEKLRELSVRATNFEAQKSHIADRIQEKYQTDLPLDLDMVEFDLEQIEKRIKRSQRFIENLGPINMGVQDEFDAEQGRLNFLKEQEADLVEAKTSLLETISKLDRIARRQFRETFGLIQEHFKGTFSMLFDGGDANLMLEDPDDLLESDIIIKATPRGKKTQNLKMLSAGEKALTAIALLFAIYQVKPSPYCVLDEIDAPLDDRNIRKYTKMLEHFTTHTQFIVITHNKLTMEAAKYLYGVTMEEEGVSRLVSVQFN
ncbi:MAG: chromosome segregation protein SMC [Candidatus Marinimicrobia bacterium]|nr:chromosome segregation protein SMC [Candidatus Neomarinimicrobiota bacterium]MCF7850545.1 chromosome segregation protein SMC [Candidatus Neomarinimicrobiota bacterium]MCF7904119.1 chromosome segregation protein SMC [Candidatus Neomarinimicrobiota bacterium]